ncbi:hypothetical protein K440DRAFT_613848 [Wilcoxina mikolae CBS 423.85]|nr:hypothetical protein K440DRAFT_613848 [Wilcoxina mikolae CBS 423.85]
MRKSLLQLPQGSKSKSNSNSNSTSKYSKSKSKSKSTSKRYLVEQTRGRKAEDEEEPTSASPRK